MDIKAPGLTQSSRNALIQGGNVISLLAIAENIVVAIVILGDGERWVACSVRCERLYGQYCRCSLEKFQLHLTERHSSRVLHVAFGHEGS